MFGSVSPSVEFKGIASRTKSHENQQNVQSKPNMLFNRFSPATKSTKLIRFIILAICVKLFLVQGLHDNIELVDGSVLMKVCDPREIKTVTNRVCMLYKRTKNSDIKLDRQGNLRVTRDAEEGEMSPDKLATECCKKGCPPQIFAVNCS